MALNATSGNDARIQSQPRDLGAQEAVLQTQYKKMLGDLDTQLTAVQAEVERLEAQAPHLTAEERGRLFDARERQKALEYTRSLASDVDQLTESVRAVPSGEAFARDVFGGVVAPINSLLIATGETLLAGFYGVTGWATGNDIVVEAGKEVWQRKNSGAALKAFWGGGEMIRVKAQMASAILEMMPSKMLHEALAKPLSQKQKAVITAILDRRQ